MVRKKKKHKNDFEAMTLYFDNYELIKQRQAN